MVNKSYLKKSNVTTNNKDVLTDIQHEIFEIQEEKENKSFRKCKCD